MEATFKAFVILVAVTCFSADCNAIKKEPDKIWVHSSFREFVKGSFYGSGNNLYVNANGVIETIHRFDVNNDGYVDIAMANNHDYIERGPTHIYTMVEKQKKEWDRQQLANDSGWISRILDIDKDGFADLIVVNGENGVTSALSSYVYWGTPEGIGSMRTELPTMGAYDVAVIDINLDGRLDMIFPSAWQDHHNPGKPILARIYLADNERKFTDATQKYALSGTAAVSVTATDLNKDGFPDLVMANYRNEHNYNTESFIYWGTKDGFDTETPSLLSTYAPLHVITADLNHDGWDDIIFSGGNQIRIFWNKSGQFVNSEYLLIEEQGYSTAFCKGNITCDVADVDGDGKNDLVMTTSEGVQIRSSTDLLKIQTFLPMTHVNWVTVSDLDGDGWKDLVVSRYDNGVSFDTNSVVYWNSPDGFSKDRGTLFHTEGAVGNAAGDLNGDGQNELVFNNTMIGHLGAINNYIYLGNKNAEYGVKNRLELPTDGSMACAIADLNLDGYPEVIFDQHPRGKQSFLRIYTGDPNGPTADRFTDLLTNDGLASFEIADFDRDGYLDIVACCDVRSSKPKTFIYYGSKNGFSTSHFDVIETDYDDNIYYLVDINNDGYLDLAFFQKKKEEILIYIGSQDGYSESCIKKLPCPGLTMCDVVNAADLNHDGWLDLILSISGHYFGSKDTLSIFYGSAKGYRIENTQKYMGDYSPIRTAVSDWNRDGNLDLFVSAYSSTNARVIPSQLFWGNGVTLDFNTPTNLLTEGAVGALAVDFNHDNWTDLFVVCHRNDLGHQVDSLIFWNGPNGFSTEKITRLPGLGPHATQLPDHGNAYTREPKEYYISPPFNMEYFFPYKIDWKADIPSTSQLKFQLRWAITKKQLNKARWMGPGGEDTYFERSGESFNMCPDNTHWLQYKALFVSPYDCNSPKLREVSISLKPSGN
ncbi:MAG: FG-GAP repeat domain-containing protein [Sedimentisphaerales bacterium]